jgi:hypothetical protein
MLLAFLIVSFRNYFASFHYFDSFTSSQLTAAMARNRKPLSGRTTVTSDGSLGWEAAGDEETSNEVDTVHVTDQFSASFPLA